MLVSASLRDRFQCRQKRLSDIVNAAQAVLGVADRHQADAAIDPEVIKDVNAHTRRLIAVVRKLRSIKSIVQS